MEKSRTVFRLSLSVLATFFFLSAGPMTATVRADDDAWKKVRTCHNALRSKMKECARSSKSKCSKSALKAFEKCVQKETKDAKLKKGSSYKKLSQSVQKVVDAVQPLFKKCYAKTSDYEKEHIAEAKKKAKDKKELKSEIKKIQKDAEKIRAECFATAQKMSNKALEAQVGQHFEQ